VPPALLLAAATAIARPDPAPALVVALALTLAAIVLLAATLYAGRGRDEPPRLHFMLAFAVAGLASVCASLACLTVTALTRAA
jgi:hypothetical protein